MRLLTLLMLLPSTALAQGLMTFEELGELHPDRECFSMHGDLEAVGIPHDLVAFDHAYLEERGGGYTVQDVGDVSFIGGPWTYNSLSGDAVQGTLVKFLETHENDYDFISIFVTQSLNFGAFYAPLANTTRGIGRQVYNNGIDGFDELEGYLFMNSIFDYLYNDTETARDALFFGQETGHRWGSFVRRRGGGYDMLGRDQSHWNFFMDTDNSVMEGNAWVEADGNNRWETDHLAPIGYSGLDMYLMGFIPPEEVDPWLLIQNPQVVWNPAQWGQGELNAASTPYYYVRDFVEGDNIPSILVSGEPVTVSIDDVIFVSGERVPTAAESQREFRMAFVIMHPESEPVDFDDYLVVEDTRLGLADLWEEMVFDEAVLNTQLGTSESYLFRPGVFTPTAVFEPDLFEVDENGDLVYEGDVAGEGCEASVAGGGSSLLALFALGWRRRRA